MVYLITNEVNQRQYVGKKVFKFSRSKKLKTRKRRIHTKVVSDWETYYGSNKELQADVEKHGREHFRREVLHLCKTKAECSYWEAHEQFTREVIFRPDQYYNGWISVKISRLHFHKK